MRKPFLARRLEMPMAGSVLVLADEPVIAALVGMLVELAGHQPVFATAGEPFINALRRLRPLAVVVIGADVDDAKSDLFYAAAARRGIGVVVFGSQTHTRIIG